MIHFINIDEVANFRIRKYSENLSISIFPLQDSTRKKKHHLTLSSFSQGRILKRSDVTKILIAYIVSFL
jgi:hypothetical protein